MSYKYLVRAVRMERSLTKEPDVAFVSFSTPYKLLRLFRYFNIHVQASNIMPVHMIPELKTNSLIWFETPTL